MKKKVKMTCIFKSGYVLQDTIKVDRKDSKAWQTIKAIQKGVEEYMTQKDAGPALITWGKTSVQLSEVAAISFKG